MMGRRWGWTITMLALTGPALAQQQATDLPLWEAGLFGGAAATPAYPGAEDRSSRAVILPMLIYRGKVVRADRSGVNARLLATERVEVDLGFALSLGVVVGDARLNQYFYEVAPQYATAVRPAYHAGGGFMMTRLGASLSRRLAPDWRVFGFSRYDNYSQAANRDSPLFRRNSGWSVGLGFAWTGYRSPERAWE